MGFPARHCSHPSPLAQVDIDVTRVLKPLCLHTGLVCKWTIHWTINQLYCKVASFPGLPRLQRYLITSVYWGRWQGRSGNKAGQCKVPPHGTPSVCLTLHDITADDKIGLPCLQFLIACSMGSKTGGGKDLGMRLVLTSPNEMYWCCLANIAVFNIVLRARHTSAKREGSSELFIQAMSRTLLSEVQSHCSILSRDTLHHCLSSNDSLENSVHATAGAAKNTSREACTFHSRYSVFQECITRNLVRSSS